ncbi:uncharacterized protein LOC110675779 [Aedes aegypti]|uniref:Uncharacterized protein n=1 Tax=Aedes aegypti TaxID=7159 RepID=A0A6I8U648_AEDAE|nr:uncharacterized protein LOC110675779 [Aedes aegypti]
MSRNLSHCSDRCNANHSEPHLHRNCTFFTRQRRATHVCRRLTLTTSLTVTTVTVLGVILAILGPATMAPTGDGNLSITKVINGERINYNMKFTYNPSDRSQYPVNRKTGRQEAILEYFRKYAIQI